MATKKLVTHGDIDELMKRFDVEPEPKGFHNWNAFVPSIATPQDAVVGNLMRAGYVLIGSGTFSCVFRHRDIKGTVIKVSREFMAQSDGWTDYARVARIHSAHNKCFPSIKRMLVQDMVRPGESYVVSEIEALHTLYDLPHPQSVNFRQRACHMRGYMENGTPAARDAVYEQWGAGLGNSITSAIDTIKATMGSTHYFDLHKDNIMYRKDSNVMGGWYPVITDPVSDRKAS